MKAGAQGSRFGILINRLWGLGNQPTPVDVAPEVIPTTDITSSRFEYLAPRGEAAFMGQRNQAAVVGELSFVGIRNPAGSRRCLILDAIISAATATELLQPRMARGSTVTSADEAGTAGLRGMDSRMPDSELGILATNGSAAAAVGTATGLIPIFDDMGWVQLNVVLAPGSMFRLYRTAANTLITNLTFIGYHRPCDPEEMRV